MLGVFWKLSSIVGDMAESYGLQAAWENMAVGEREGILAYVRGRWSTLDLTPDAHVGEHCTVWLLVFEALDFLLSASSTDFFQIKYHNVVKMTFLEHKSNHVTPQFKTHQWPRNKAQLPDTSVKASMVCCSVHLFMSTLHLCEVCSHSSNWK